MNNPTFSALLKTATERLERAGVEDARFDSRCMMSKAAGKSFGELMFSLTDSVETETERVFMSFVERREKREPLQYILGEWDFYSMTFAVREGVLVPREETEFLAETAVRETPKDGVVFDVCSGSGCIGISVAKNRPDTTVYLFEKYDSPFLCLCENIKRHSLSNVKAVKCDMTQGVPEGLPHPDVILSNPPYIESRQIETLQEEVRNEPREALDGGDDGYDFYRYLSKSWYGFLKDGGIISVECGENMPQTVAKMFPSSHSAELSDDIFGIQRFVTVKK